MASEVSARVPEDWISPQEQLEMLIIPDKEVIEIIFNTALSVWDVASIVAKYAHNLSPHLSNWHTALYRFNLVSDTDKIPPMPFKIHEVLDRRFLYLCPPLSTYDITECAKSYGRNHLADYEGLNPFLHYIWPPAHAEHIHTGSNEWQWLLIKDVWTEFFSDPSKERVMAPLQTVAELNTGEFVNYKIPSMQQMVAFSLFYKVATQNKILPNARAILSDRHYTPIHETTQGKHLVITASAEGLIISHSSAPSINYVVATT